jgi:hypothetical protein
MSAEVVVEIGGCRQVVDDPEVAAHIAYLLRHRRQLDLRGKRAYTLEVIRTPKGTAYRVRDDGLPFVERPPAH